MDVRKNPMCFSRWSVRRKGVCHEMELEKIDVETKKEKQFNKKGIYSVEDLLRFLPKSYLDFRTPKSISECVDGDMCSVVATVLKVNIYHKCISVLLRDQISMKNFKCIWFGQSYMVKKLQGLYGKDVFVCGTVIYNRNYGIYEMSNPIVFSEEVEKNQRIYPVYSKIEGMSAEYLQNSLCTALERIEVVEKYDEETRKYFRIITEKELYQKIHYPVDEEDIKMAKRRLVFEELYDFAFFLEKNNRNSISVSPYVVRQLTKTNHFLKNLPYELTFDQQEVLMNMVEQMKNGKRVNSLVQGDVGTGKTIVAFILMIAMAENGYQSVLMAPTSVLAEQHFIEMNSYAQQLGFKVAYLGSKMKVTEKRTLLKGIKSGEYQFVIGTHSVISKDVEFNKLGLSVVDEEHRFGVGQRQKLIGMENVHSVTMSATPIPRTMALTMYGKEMNVCTIKTKPNGRKPVQTAINNSDINIYQFMKKQIAEGRQCYIVCALKEESKIPVESVAEVYEKTIDFFEGTGVKVGTLVGGMDKDEMKETLRQFSANEIQILIATTIVEVGVNVPNASIIVIRDADRFGLSTLHQLRGRVGRGKYQSYCILKSPNKTNPRLQAMCETTDGFEIAKKDLQIRGSGDFLGTKQSGENKSVMLMLRYPKFYHQIEKYITNKLDKELVLKFN